MVQIQHQLCTLTNDKNCCGVSKFRSFNFFCIKHFFLVTPAFWRAVYKMLQRNISCNINEIDLGNSKTVYGTYLTQ